MTKHLSLLTVKESEEDKNTTQYSGAKAIQTVSERVASPISEEDVPDSLSLKDSLAAVCNATQAAARIHQIFRIQSFQRKQLIEQVDDGTSSEEHALSILAAKKSRLGQNDVNAHAAAVSIQKKYRGWKKRKEFLIIRERIVKIQVDMFFPLLKFVHIFFLMFDKFLLSYNLRNFFVGRSHLTVFSVWFFRLPVIWL